MAELEYLIKHGGLTPKRLLKTISRRGFGASILGAIGCATAPRLLGTQEGSDFTIAIIPDPQFLAESCPDNSGVYYASMMKWIVDHKNIVFTSSKSAFNANIKA